MQNLHISSTLIPVTVYVFEVISLAKILQSELLLSLFVIVYLSASFSQVTLHDVSDKYEQLILMTFPGG